MRYPKIGLEVNLGGGEGRGEGVLWLRVKEGGEVWLGVYISLRCVSGKGGGQEQGFLEDIEGS